MARIVKGESRELVILAIDQATTTGWACNKPNVSGTVSFALKRGESPGMRFVRFEIWLEKMISRVRPSLIIYERQNHRGGAATEVSSGFVAHIQKVAAKHNINHTNCQSTTLKKFATGKGNAKKEEMMQAFVDKWGRGPKDDNEADAKWLLEYAKNEYSAR